METNLHHHLHHGPIHRLPRPRPPVTKNHFRASAKTKGSKSEAGGRAPPLTLAAQSPAVKKTVYEDNWFDRLAIEHLSSSIRDTIGEKKNSKTKEGYEGLVEAAAMIAIRHDAMEQKKMVVEALDKAFPPAILSMIRVLVGQSKFSKQFFATFTTIFFAWLVGPCEVRDSEFHGKREKNVVYIPKCRFLEATNCAGMCVNLCKLPSQEFINKQLGVPTTMIPNFEDQSCQIIFGEVPPADDPALKQPCYQTRCIAKGTHGVDCSS